MDARDRRKRKKKGLTTKEHEETFWNDGNILDLDCSGDYITICVYPNTELFTKKCEFYVNNPDIF